MKIFNLPRGAGKTYLCAKHSNRTGATVLCANQGHKQAVKDRAKEQKIVIPEPITVNELLNELLTTKKLPQKLIIDEALIVLCALLRRIYTISGQSLEKIIGMTLSDDDNDKKMWIGGKKGKWFSKGKAVLIDKYI